MAATFGANYLFEMNQVVKISVSGETGAVIARAEYANAENHYYVRYSGGDGRATESWWGESALMGA